MYPESVVEISKRIYEVFEEDLVESSSQDKEWCEPIGMESINKFMLPKFIKGEELLLTEQEAIDLYRMCLADISIASLKEKGLVDSIEDENGKEMIFLTEIGKSVQENSGYKPKL